MLSFAFSNYTITQKSIVIVRELTLSFRLKYPSWGFQSDFQEIPVCLALCLYIRGQLYCRNHPNYSNQIHTKQERATNRPEKVCLNDLNTTLILAKKPSYNFSQAYGSNDFDNIYIICALHKSRGPLRIGIQHLIPKKYDLFLSHSWSC